MQLVTRDRFGRAGPTLRPRLWMNVANARPQLPFFADSGRFTTVTGPSRAGWASLPQRGRLEDAAGICDVLRSGAALLHVALPRKPCFSS